MNEYSEDYFSIIYRGGSYNLSFNLYKDLGQYILGLPLYSINDPIYPQESRDLNNAIGEQKTEQPCREKEIDPLNFCLKPAVDDLNKKLTNPEYQQFLYTMKRFYNSIK